MFTQTLNTRTSVEPSCNNSGFEYDRTKYQEMLLDAAETTLGIFGFDRYIIWKTKGQEMMDAISLYS